VTEEVLNRAGVETVGDLQDYPGDLRALIGSFGPKLRLLRLLGLGVANLHEPSGQQLMLL
jgi:hypothetical protein